MRSLLILLVIICSLSFINTESLKAFKWKDPPVLGTTLGTNPNNAAQTAPTEDVYYGGFSGVVYEGKTDTGAHAILVAMDRGPTTSNIKDAVMINGDTMNAKPMVLPNYVPELVRIHVNFEAETATVVGKIQLSKPDGTPLSGKPNIQVGKRDLAFTDTPAVDLFGNKIDNDPMGADIESIVAAADGSFWCGDEFRPSLYHFDTQGKMMKRFIPAGAPTAGGAYGEAVLPDVYAKRVENRGFEAIALEGDILYAWLQSPLDNPDDKDDITGLASRNIRILAFNTVSETVEAEYVHVLDAALYNREGNLKVDKISDAVSLGGGKFLVMERDGNGKLATAIKNLVVVDINGATNINDAANLAGLGSQTIEQVTDFAAVGIVPVKKTVVSGLTVLGWKPDNVEGLAIVDANTVIVVSDNSYQMSNDFTPTGNGTAFFDRGSGTHFGIVTGLSLNGGSTDTETTSTPATPLPTAPQVTGGGAGQPTVPGGSQTSTTNQSNGSASFNNVCMIAFAAVFALLSIIM